MNPAELARNGLTLRIIPPRTGCDYFASAPNYDALLSAIQQLRGVR